MFVSVKLQNFDIVIALF